MIDWLWLIPAFLVGTFVGGWAEHLSDKKVQRGAALGVIGTILAFIGLS
jgi:hypothetical protein